MNSSANVSGVKAPDMTLLMQKLSSTSGKLKAHNQSGVTRLLITVFALLERSPTFARQAYYAGMT